MQSAEGSGFKLPSWIRGAVLYDGETSASFGDRLFAVPIRAVWER